MRTYLRVKKDICPKCKHKREIVERGKLTRKRIEIPEKIIGFKCNNCNSFKRSENN